MIPLFVGQRIARRTAAGLDFLGQADHLVDRLLAVELHDEIPHELRQIARRFVRARGRQLLDHHRDHHVRPAFADQAQRPVEVEYGKPRRRCESDLADDLHTRAGQETRRTCFGDAALVILFVGD